MYLLNRNPGKHGKRPEDTLAGIPAKPHMYADHRHELRVIDMAKAAGVSVETVRYYTRNGLLKAKRDTQNNYRLYGRSELIKLRFIKRAKTLGYTLSEIKKIIQASMERESPCPIVREIITNRIAANKQHISEVVALQKRMESAVKQWKLMPDAVPIGDSICHLVENQIDLADTDNLSRG